VLCYCALRWLTCGGAVLWRLKSHVHDRAFGSVDWPVKTVSEMLYDVSSRT